MLPIPGFDGFGALEPFLPESFLRSIAPFRQYGPLLFLFVLLRGSSFSSQLWDAIDGLFRVFGGQEGGADLGSALFRFWTSSYELVRDSISQRFSGVI
jgi:Zn-dependent protease